MTSRGGFGMRRPRGICTGCGQGRMLRADGTVRKHDEPDTLTTCSGSGLPPRSVTATPWDKPVDTLSAPGDTVKS